MHEAGAGPGWSGEDAIVVWTEVESQYAPRDPGNRADSGVGPRMRDVQGFSPRALSRRCATRKVELAWVGSSSVTLA